MKFSFYCMLCFTTYTILVVLLTSVRGFNLIILHTNDIHAHIEEMNKYTSECKNGDKEKGLCYGGISRRITKVNEIRSQNKNVVLLDAGDQFQGSLWFNIYKGKEAALFMNKLKYDAMAIGNHEFDNGIDGFVQFLDNVTFPVINCNINTSREPKLQSRFNKSIILNINGQKIGVIGYTTEETAYISNGGDSITFKSVIETVREEVKRLRNLGIQIIIGLGHYGYSHDKKLAETVDGLDIIVGGHSHTFLYTGSKPSNDVPEGPYPTIVENNNRKVLIVQSYWAGKYLGFLNVSFKDDGDVESWKGDPILLDHTVNKDEEMEAILNTMKPAIEKEKGKVVGYSAVYLEGDRKVCRLQECNLGNLITDAMVSYHASKHNKNDSWTSYPISIMNSGGIRSPIEQGNISKGDVLTALPFGNLVDAITIKGKYLRAALEHAVANYDPIDSPGAFLQVSGLRVTYNLCNKPGSRVVTVLTRCSDCLMPSYKLLNEDKTYTVIALNFVIRGGDGFKVIQEHKIEHIEYNSLDSNVFIQYLQNHSPIIKGIEGRITLLDECENSTATEIPEISTPFHTRTTLTECKCSCINSSYMINCNIPTMFSIILMFCLQRKLSYSV